MESSEAGITDIGCVGDRMSRIEWTDKAINPIVGCSKISDGCQNCYAEKMAWRQAHIKTGSQSAYQEVVSNGKWNGKTAFVPSAFDDLKTWKKPRRIFVGSMCDVFHESVKYEWQEAIFDKALEYPQHTFIFLTKRPENMKKLVCDYFFNRNRCSVFLSQGGYFIDDNIWLGVTVESQKYISRIDDLLKIPAKVRFISVEPMLSEVIIPQDKLRQLQWVICGGETGNNSRYAFPDWVRGLKDQCVSAGAPFFFKKWGDATYVSIDYTDGFIDGVEYRQFPKGEIK